MSSTEPGDGLAAAQARLGLAVPPPALRKAQPVLGAPHPVTSGGGRSRALGSFILPHERLKKIKMNAMEISNFYIHHSKVVITEL